MKGQNCHEEAACLKSSCPNALTHELVWKIAEMRRYRKKAKKISELVNVARLKSCCRENPWIDTRFLAYVLEDNVDCKLS